MESVYRERLEQLMLPWCDTGFIAELLGISLTDDPALAAAFRTWSDRFLGLSLVERIHGSPPQIHRHALETFLVQNGLVSRKWAAVYLGMPTDTLTAVLEQLAARSVPLAIESTLSKQVVRQREAAELHRAFPAMRHVTFSDHTHLCRRLHEVIRNELGIEIEPVLCETSKILDPDDTDIAAAFDSITFEPVGLRYQIWLVTGKPVNLRPDVCSWKFYARNQEALRDLVMRGSDLANIDPRLLLP